jgi:hypothetical protein
MSLLKVLSSLFSKNDANEVRGSVYLVDGEAFVPGGDRNGPIERVQVLKRLGAFATREQFEMKVVLGGRPLREANDGDEFSGVKVYYAAEGKSVSDRLEALSKSAGRKGLVVTSDPRLEANLRDRKVPILRSATLRRALELGDSDGGSGSGRDDQDRSNNDRDRGRSRRPRGRRRSGPREGGPREGGSREGGSREGGRRSDQSPVSSDNTSSSSPSVKSLIDLVD